MEMNKGSTVCIEVLPRFETVIWAMANTQGLVRARKIRVSHESQEKEETLIQFNQNASGYTATHA
jgi:hypothetical protein